MNKLIIQRIRRSEVWIKKGNKREHRKRSRKSERKKPV